MPRARAVRRFRLETVRILGAAVMVLVACGPEVESQPTPDGAVVTACTTEAECSAPTPYCEPTTSVCVGCRFDSHCPESICEANACRPARSCKELHAALPGLPSGSYTLDHDGAGPKAAFDAYCDMTTDGGGWTALLNPESMAQATHPDLVASTVVLSGTQSCEAATVPQPFVANGWRGLLAYACGVVTFELSLAWTNSIAATDVMFIATLQGETTRTVTVDGTAASANATATDAGGATCAFYNSTASAVSPALNGCFQTSLAAPPRVSAGVVSGDLAFVITTGPACAPSCQHGTGMNIQKLFVR
jgi:hypothetical protein